MPSVQCPQCGISREFREEYRGRRIRCRACNTIVDIPSSLGDSDSAQEDSGLKLPPVKIGRFVLRELVGEGGFGLVYKAFDPQLERDVALKLPRPGSLNSKQRIRRFHEDARAAAQLKHPHIVTVHDAGEVNGQFYIASAFVKGGTLERAVEAGPFEIHRAVEIVRRLAEALAYAHSQGVVHRDIKPSNILLDEFDEPHVIDFGLAHRDNVTDVLKELDEAVDSRSQGESLQRTQMGAVIGTVPYMSPEAAAGHACEANPAMDQYSLGIVLYELLLGDRPFRGTLHEVVHQHIHTAPPSIREVRPDVSLDLEAICLKCLEKNPADRYESCTALADDLRRFLDDRPVTARQRGWSERLWKWLQGNLLVGLLLLMTLASLLIGLAASLWFAWSESLAKQRADEQKLQEQQARLEADRKKEEARQAVLEQERLLELIRRDQYFDLIARTERELRDGQLARAKDLLARAGSLKTKHGWELDYLQTECKTMRPIRPAPWTLAIVSDPGGGPDWLAWATDHKVVFRRGMENPGPGDIFSVSQGEERSPVTALAVSPLGTYLAVGHESGAVVLYEKKDDSYAFLLQRRPATPRVTAIDVTEQGRIAWGCLNGTVGYQASLLSEPRLQTTWHTGSIRSARFTPIQTEFVTCCSSAILRLNRAEDLTLSLDRPLESVTAAAILLEHVPVGSAQVPPPKKPDPSIAPSDHVGVADPELPVTSALGLLSAGVDGLLYLYVGSKGAGQGTGTALPPRQLPDPVPMARSTLPSPGGLVLPVPKHRIIAKAGGVLAVLARDFSEQAHFRGHFADVIALHTSSETGRIASLDETGVFKLWRIQDRDTIELMTLHTDGGVALGADGNTVAWSEGNRTIKYRRLNGNTWSFDRFTGGNLTDGRNLDSLSGHTGYTHAVAYCRHGADLISAGSHGAERAGNLRGELDIWKTTPQTLHTRLVTNGAEVRCTDATQRGRVAWAGASGRIRLGWIDEPERAAELEGHTGEVKAVRFHPHGYLLASAGVDRRVLVWDDDLEGKEIKKLRSFTDSQGTIFSLSWSAAGDRILAGNDRGDILVWPVSENRLSTVWKHHDRPINALAADAQNRYLASGSNDGSIQIRDAASGNVLHTIPQAHRNGVLALAFIPDGTRLASVGRDRLICLWEVGTWREALTVPSRVGLREGLAFYPGDARELAVATVEGIRLLRSSPQGSR